MNQKDRIIELVKQNVISMEDALDLLEASQNDELNSSEQTSRNKRKQPFDVNEALDSVLGQGKQIAKEMNDYFKRDDLNKEEVRPSVEEIEDERQVRLQEIKNEIEILQEQLKQEEDALTINQQRLREIEIFGELDELTEEMTQEQGRLVAQQEVLEAERQSYLNQLQALQDENKQLLKEEGYQSKQDFKEFINESTDKITEKANQFSEEAVREGKKVGTYFTNLAHDLKDSFKRKDVQIDISFPWLKSVEETYEKSYPAQEVKNIDVEMFNGSLTIEAYEGEEIQLVAQAKLYGKEVKKDFNFFEEMSLVQEEGEQFLLHVKDKKVAADVHLKVPKREFALVSFKSTNGAIRVKELQAQALDLDLLNGDLELNHHRGEKAHIKNVNGKAKIQNSEIETLVYSNLNGDFRISDSVGNIDVDMVNGNIYITKTDLQPSNMQVKTINGFVKVAVPKESNLDITAESLRANIEDRLDDVDTITKNNKRKKLFKRTVKSESPLVYAHIETKQGTIYLKDH